MEKSPRYVMLAAVSLLQFWSFWNWDVQLNSCVSAEDGATGSSTRAPSVGPRVVRPVWMVVQVDRSLMGPQRDPESMLPHFQRSIRRCADAPRGDTSAGSGANSIRKAAPSGVIATSGLNKEDCG